MTDAPTSPLPSASEREVPIHHPAFGSGLFKEVITLAIQPVKARPPLLRNMTNMIGMMKAQAPRER